MWAAAGGKLSASSLPADQKGCRIVHMPIDSLSDELFGISLLADATGDVAGQGRHP